MIFISLASIVLILLGAAQAGVVFVLRRFAARHALPITDSDERLLPRAAIVLSLRGADPHLETGLRQLLTQDYPDHRLVVVVDHRQDPSWDCVEAVVNEVGADRLDLQELQQRYPHCGLKCSALIQAIESLDESVEIVVFADADVVAHDHWLENLVRPLLEPKVGLVTGAQWFEPPDSAIGSWIRSIWNSGATVPTILLNHPWAGSCAVRRQDLLRSGLVDRWKNSIVDDGPMAAAISGLGLELRFVTNAWMINREHCSLSFSMRYLKRMLTWSRLYEPTYAFTVLHAVLCAGLMTGIALATLWAGWSGQWAIGLVGAVSLLIFASCSVFGYTGVRRIVRTFALQRGEQLDRLTLAGFLMLLIGLPVTYWVYAWAAVSALWVRRVRWRGIEYEILSGHDVRLSHYEPYRVESTTASHSI